MITILTHLIIYAPCHVHLFLASPPTKISSRQSSSLPPPQTSPQQIPDSDVQRGDNLSTPHVRKRLQHRSAYLSFPPHPSLPSPTLSPASLSSAFLWQSFELDARRSARAAVYETRTNPATFECVPSRSMWRIAQFVVWDRHEIDLLADQAAICIRCRRILGRRSS